jgi:cation diffusion facilitator CzcD-associated flavoprotein CzcO
MDSNHGMRPTACVVGAGPAGLIAARALRAERVEVTVFERRSDVGGIWDIDAPGSPMYDSAHFISSKYTSGFLGFPMPDHFPDYPNHRQILEYVRAFADAFELRPLVRFGSDVRRTVRNHNGIWHVETSDGAFSFDALVCANGVTWEPNVPNLPGQHAFRGQIRHSVTYRDRSEFANQRVVIVGGGNSGVDIACDAAANATRAHLSLRRGYWLLPKHICGLPTDVFFAHGADFPAWVGTPPDLSALLRFLVGDNTRFGLAAPDHEPLESHPIMNTQLLNHVAHGRIAVHPDVDHLDESGVVFADGERCEADVVMLATGYHHRIPFLADQTIDELGGRPDLYLNMFHRSIGNLYALGFIEFASAAYQQFDRMAQLIALDIAAPRRSERARKLAELKANHHPDLRGGRSYVKSARHANYVDVTTFRRVLAEVRAALGAPPATDWAIVASDSAGRAAS